MKFVYITLCCFLLITSNLAINTNPKQEISGRLNKEESKKSLKKQDTETVNPNNNEGNNQSGNNENVDNTETNENQLISNHQRNNTHNNNNDENNNNNNNNNNHGHGNGNGNGNNNDQGNGHGHGNGDNNDHGNGHGHGNGNNNGHGNGHHHDNDSQYYFYSTSVDYCYFYYCPNFYNSQFYFDYYPLDISYWGGYGYGYSYADSWLWSGAYDYYGGYDYDGFGYGYADGIDGGMDIGFEGGFDGGYERTYAPYLRTIAKKSYKKSQLQGSKTKAVSLKEKMSDFKKISLKDQRAGALKELAKLKLEVFNDKNFDTKKFKAEHKNEVYSTKWILRELQIAQLAKLQSKLDKITALKN